ncbi:DUF6122 family protein [Arenibacter amylolyticus]|uniref:DUF6122 family protein n=1 Tax=Arenibacter amylolyticus TaxID=1406873 RepID=UPI000A3D35A5|nr:DUF6122 family protein [Arenibacter amylolyticus]
MLRWFLHYGIHFLVPILIGLLFYKGYRWKAILILLAGIVIDLDHFWADPLFDPNRCSINFHPLHTYWAIALYVLLLIPKKTRIFGLALVIHIVADITDCLLM